MARIKGISTELDIGKIGFTDRSSGMAKFQLDRYLYEEARKIANPAYDMAGLKYVRLWWV
jgi:hypothetical protein